MKLTDAQLAELARLVAATREREIDCDEMMHRAAAFLDVVAADATKVPHADIPDALAEVAQHLRVCPECREEIELLLESRGAP